MTCPHCQATLPARTYYCKFCGQNIPPEVADPRHVAPAKMSGRKRGLFTLLFGSCVLLMAALAVGVGVRMFTAEPSLRVTAGRWPLVFEFTNREDVAINNCIVGIADGDVYWASSVDAPIAPLETRRVAFSTFKAANDAPLPSYLRAQTVTVRCDVGKDRREAFFK